MSKSSSVCVCEACIGSNCNCGCQEVAAPSAAPCACGADCRGGAACGCGACNCEAPVDASLAGYR